MSIEYERECNPPECDGTLTHFYVDNDIRKVVCAEHGSVHKIHSEVFILDKESIDVSSLTSLVKIATPPLAQEEETNDDDGNE